jgi:hypothetical protein
MARVATGADFGEGQAKLGYLVRREIDEDEADAAVLATAAGARGGGRGVSRLPDK